MRFPAFAALCSILTLALPLVSIKQNRIVTGEAIRLFELHPLFIIAGIVFLGLVLFLIVSRRADAVTFLISAGLFMLLVLGGVQYLHSTVEEWNVSGFARISFSSGFWFFILTLYLFLSFSYREARSTLTRRLTVIVPLLISAVFIFSGLFNDTAILLELFNHRDKFRQELLRHLFLSLTSVGAATLIGVPAGIKAARSGTWSRRIFKFVNGIQTVPSLALFGLMIAPLAFLSRSFPLLRSIGIAGIGTAPALIALSLYALLPIIRNTYTGITQIEPQIRSAAIGMGMNHRQVFRFIELPLSTPLVLTGLRISLVQSIGNTAVAALIGAGGLGTFIFQGLGQSVPDLILLGVIPVILLSLLMDRLFHAGEIMATPKGVRAE